MDREQRKQYVIRTWTEILLIGLGYFLLVLFTPFRIPCPIRFLTGYQCPGCGVTRMVMALSRLDFRQAFLENAYVLCLLPVLIPWGIWRTKKYVEEGAQEFTAVEVVFLVLALASAIIFGIIRNM
ncbi:MAG: DUF2752 domain-containing protein [Clostridium sp.]|nr:DUF2752 domain-containing protein [Clostridium sp.]